MKWKPSRIFIEGWLYWYTAFGTGMLGILSTEEAYKYCNPTILFWLRALLESSIGGFNALKAFRSMSYGRDQDQKSGNTQFFTKSTPPDAGQPKFP